VVQIYWVDEGMFAGVVVVVVVVGLTYEPSHPGAGNLFK